jgi:hypothetical protein
MPLGKAKVRGLSDPSSKSIIMTTWRPLGRTIIRAIWGPSKRSFIMAK